MNYDESGTSCTQKMEQRHMLFTMNGLRRSSLSAVVQEMLGNDSQYLKTIEHRMNGLKRSMERSSCGLI